MPFALKTLDGWRQQSRDYVVAKLPPRAVLLPNSPLRVASDNQSGLAFDNMLYLEWLSKQLLADTAEKEWLDRHAAIWLPNNGRKSASFSVGSATITGINGSILPSGAIFSANAADGTPLRFQTTVACTVGVGATSVSVVALTEGAAGNLTAGSSLSLTAGPPGGGVNATAIVVSLTGGNDAEIDDQLRVRVLQRIQKPPMGGDADDYVAWALQVPGVTRAWCSPLEMGVGTVTVRFMMDVLRATTNPSTDGFPLSGDLATVLAYLNTKRPVAVRDFFVPAPVPEAINYTVHLIPDTTALRSASEASVAAMLMIAGAPAFSINGVGQSAQTIYAAWVNDAILNTPGITALDLTMADHVMPGAGSIAVFGTATYA